MKTKITRNDLRGQNVFSAGCGMPGKRLDYELCRRYEELARVLTREQRPALLEEFLSIINSEGV